MSDGDEVPENELIIKGVPRLPGKTVYPNEQSRMEIDAIHTGLLRKIESRERRSAGETEDEDKPSPAKIPHIAPLIAQIRQSDNQGIYLASESGTDFSSCIQPEQRAPLDAAIPEVQNEAIENPWKFNELVKSMGAIKLGYEHKRIVETLLVQDPKRNARVLSRFCSSHLAGFDLDEESSVPLGPRYPPDLSMKRKRLTNYVSAHESFDMADSSIEVISLRVVRVGPKHTYPVEVYGKVIARDEVDHKCVYLFKRERKDAQLIQSEKDMLALTGPYRPLVTLAWMYFEFDLKIKGQGEPDDDLQLSKGVILYYYKSSHKRLIDQLPSFQSTVKLVLQLVPLPVAASIEVSVREVQGDTTVHYDGKITAGTTKDYRQHMLVYDSSVPSSVGLIGRNGSLVLNRNMICVEGYAAEKADKMVLYLCFLDAGFEIEDEDKKRPEQEDDTDEEPEQVEDEDCDGDEEDDGDEDDDDEEEDDGEEEDVDEEEDPKNVLTLKYPLRETVWEYGSLRMKVKVDWTAVRDPPQDTDFFHRYCLLPKGYKDPCYRHGVYFE